MPTSVLIASVLKPVNDPRMYEKLGISINKLKGFQVNIAGYTGKNSPLAAKTAEGIGTFSIFRSERGSFLNRGIASFRLIWIARKLRPAYIVVCTHELLWAALVCRVFLRSKLVYDIRENYYLNILHGRSFKIWLRPLLALYVRLKERMAAPFIYHFILAEYIYLDQLAFLPERKTVIPNTSIDLEKQERDPFKILFTGTIAPETGIYECIQFARTLRELDSRYHLRIQGYAPLPANAAAIEKEIQVLPWIDANDISQFIDHQLILKEIATASIGFIHYHPVPQVNGKVPTKFYEYAIAGLPTVILGELAVPDSPNIVRISALDNAKNTVEQLNSVRSSSPPPEFLWKSHEEKLIDIFT